IMDSVVGDDLTLPQITALKKENFNLKLRIYFMEERMQQKCDDSTEDIFKTNIELKVELESMKREMAEKQELLVSASKALESLAGRDSREPHQVREQVQKEMDALRDAFNKKIADLEQVRMSYTKMMASIAEQAKCKNISMEKQLQILSASTSASHPNQVYELQEALKDKDESVYGIKVNDLWTCTYIMSKQVLTQKLEEKENELNSEKKNALKRDKTIQGLTQILREKENEVKLCHEIEDRDEALSKAREAAHKAQLQKYQGAEEHQNLLMEKQTELAQLQGEHHAKVLETQKLQRALDRKELELTGLQQAKEQLEMELEDMQQQKKKGDKALNVSKK
uniref:Centrosomin N-terminal motif 1 domain-containing protein n=1 Tax=Periophthalmus magnuspinnatus TaxID=409849 RepID=A0A3B3ZLT2_9GOBI